MAKLTLSTREDARALRSVLVSLLKECSTSFETLGISLSVGSITYRDGTASVRLEAAVLDSTGEAVTREMQDFAFHLNGLVEDSPYPGIHADDLGATFSAGGADYTLVGLKPKSRKYPFLGKRASDGKVFKFTTAALVRGLGRDAVQPRVSPDYVETVIDLTDEIKNKLSGK